MTNPFWDDEKQMKDTLDSLEQKGKISAELGSKDKVSDSFYGIETRMVDMMKILGDLEFKIHQTNLNLSKLYEELNPLHIYDVLGRIIGRLNIIMNKDIDENL